MKVLLQLAIVGLLAAASAQAQVGRPPIASVPAAGRISGVVVHAVTGQPLGGIEVSISPTEQREMSTETVTGADGRFAFDGIARGKFSLSAQGRGFSIQAYQQHGPYSTAVAVGPGLASEDLTFQLVPDASISGVVVDEENESVRNGEVLLFGRDASGRLELRGHGNLEDQGHYHFGHLTPGTYLVAISAQPWYAVDPPGAQSTVQLSIDGENSSTPTAPSAGDAASSALDMTYRTTFYADAVDGESATPIQLHPGERATADITLRALPAIHLTVRNVSTDPAQPGTVVVQQRILDRGLVTIQARTQQGGPGTVRVSGIPPGHLVLNLRSFNGKEWRSHVREVEVASDSEIDASDNSSGTVAIQGSVQFPGGTPVSAGAYIRFFNRDTNETFGAPVSAKGTFEIQQTIFGTSEYEVGVFNVRDSIVQGIAVTGAKVAGRALTLPRSGSVQLTVTMSNSFARIDGTVLRNDKALSQSMVVLVPEHPEANRDLFRRDQSDSDGTFSLYQVLPGRYTVVAIANGWDIDWQNPGVLRPYLAHGQPVEVSSTRTYKLSVAAQDAAVSSNAAQAEP